MTPLVVLVVALGSPVAVPSWLAGAIFVGAERAQARYRARTQQTAEQVLDEAA